MFSVQDNSESTKPTNAIKDAKAKRDWIIFGSQEEFEATLIAIKSPLVLKAIGRQNAAKLLSIISASAPTNAELLSAARLAKRAIRRLGAPGPFLLLRRRVFDVYSRYVRIQTLASREVDSALFFVVKNVEAAVRKRAGNRVLWSSPKESGREQ